MDDKEIVSALLAALAERVGRERYDLWFGGQIRLTLRDGVLLVETPNRFYQDWLRNQFRREIETVAAEVLNGPVALEFRISAELCQGSAAPGGTQAEAAMTAVSQVERGPIAEFATTLPAAVEALASLPFARTAAGVKTTNVTAKSNGATAAVARRSTAPIQSQPTSNSVRPRNYATMETFVVGTCNRMAHASALQAAETPGEPNPLVIYGPTGTGKTHLLEAILTAARQQTSEKLAPRRNAVYLTSEQFTSQFLEALHGGGLPMFRRKIRDIDLLLLDDAQFFANKRATLTELLHTVDTMLRDGRQLVLTADRRPHELAELGKELTTRFSGGMTAKLEPPDHATRLGIVRRFAAKLNLELGADVLDFVATHFSEHARELAGAVNRLQAVRRLTGQPLTLAKAEEALAELVHRQSRSVKLQDIERAVCNVLGLPAESLQSQRRQKTVNTTRMLAMWLARKHTRAALTEIGSYFGRRSHSTVISAQKAVGDWVNQQQPVSFGQQTWNVEEAIRRVEEQLRATG